MTKNTKQDQFHAKQLSQKIKTATNRHKLVFLTINRTTEVPDYLMMGRGVVKNVDYEALPSVRKEGRTLHLQHVYTNAINQG